MKKSFRELQKEGRSAQAVVHSVDQSLYQVTLWIDGEEHLLTENTGKTFCRHSLNEVREALALLPIETASLRQTSAYDEMIGQPVRVQDNALEVPLSLELYPPITRH
ncbi:MAG: DUF6482 family protein [Halioglobus sp.]